MVLVGVMMIFRMLRYSLSNLVDGIYYNPSEFAKKKTNMGQILSREDEDEQDQEQSQQHQSDKSDKSDQSDQSNHDVMDGMKEKEKPKRRQRNSSAISRRQKASAQGRTRRKNY